jgi:hypothetical protein
MRPQHLRGHGGIWRRRRPACPDNRVEPRVPPTSIPNGGEQPRLIGRKFRDGQRLQASDREKSLRNHVGLRVGIAASWHHGRCRMIAAPLRFLLLLVVAIAPVEKVRPARGPESDHEQHQDDQQEGDHGLHKAEARLILRNKDAGNRAGKNEDTANQPADHCLFRRYPVSSVGIRSLPSVSGLFRRYPGSLREQDVANARQLVDYANVRTAITVTMDLTFSKLCRRIHEVAVAQLKYSYPRCRAIGLIWRMMLAEKVCNRSGGCSKTNPSSFAGIGAEDSVAAIRCFRQMAADAVGIGRVDPEELRKPRRAGE